MLMSRLKHGSTVPTSSSRLAPLSLTKTVQTCGDLVPTVAERCSRQATNETVVPAKSAPVELLLSSCSMWPQHRTVAFSLSLWLFVESDEEVSTATHSAHSLSSLSTTTDLDCLPAGDLQRCACF